MRDLNSFKTSIFQIDSLNFESHALELFHFQYIQNPIYKSYVDHLGISPAQIKVLEDIPCMPIQFFKKHKITSGIFQIDKKFESSGTTGHTSTHYIEDLTFYQHISQQIFESFYGKLEDSVILGLLPSYLEQENSSLIYMVDQLICRSNMEHSGFYLDDLAGLATKLRYFSEKGFPKVFLFGVTFALLQLCDMVNLRMDNLTIIETGGMKGRGRELTREELHGKIRKSFPASRINSEYGMTELLSQAYLLEGNLFRTPPWMRILMRDLYDPLNYVENGQRGAINVIDLANAHSCAFIETEDMGLCYTDGFKVIGRMDNSDLRGCNLMLA